jgi:hypothetical protein
MKIKDQVKQLIQTLTEDEQREILNYIKSIIGRHPLEEKLNLDAEAILEAIDRANELTIRNIRGVIAEAAFNRFVLSNTDRFKLLAPVGDSSDKYDYLINDDNGEISIQVKLQRSEKGEPKILGNGMYAVEVQRTRTGKRKLKQKDDDSEEGNVLVIETRPYPFGQFDILAVCMYPSTGEWNSFMYTVSSWLIPRPKEPHLIKVLQPIARDPNEDWTDDLVTCVMWFRSGQKKQISNPRAKRTDLTD